MEPSIQEYISRLKSGGEKSQIGFCKRHRISYHQLIINGIASRNAVRSERTGFNCLKVGNSLPDIKPATQVKEVIVAHFNAAGLVTLEIQGAFSEHFL